MSIPSLDLVTSLLLKITKEEILASICSTSSKSEIGLPYFSRFMDPYSTLAILVEQVLNRRNLTPLASPRSSKSLCLNLIDIHSYELWRSRTEPENLTTEECDLVYSKPPHASSKKMLARGKTLISMMDPYLSPTFASPLSFMLWIIFKHHGPAHPIAKVRSVSNFLQNLAPSMLYFFDMNGRGLHSCRDLTLMQWFCDDILFNLLQSSPVLTTSEAFVHRISLTARFLDLGPLVAPFPVKSSTAHDGMLICRDVSLVYPSHIRFVSCYILMPQYCEWNILFFERIDLGHRPSSELIILVAYCGQLSRALFKNPVMLESEETYRFHDTLSTSQVLSTVTTTKFPEFIAEVSLTHHEFACGMLLDRFCLRFSMAYQTFLFNHVVSFFKINAPSFLAENLVNFALFGMI